MLIRSLKQIALCLSLLMISAVTKAQQSPTAEQTNDSSRGSIKGTVISDRGEPLVGASVTIRRLNMFGIAARQATTNAEGSFEAANLEPGIYAVTANVPAYVTPPRDREAVSTVYRVGDSVRLELIRGGVITGNITNANGEPLILLRVRALLVRDSNGQEVKGLLQTFGSATTDDRGIYRIYGLVPGTYIVEAGGFGNTGSGVITPHDLDGSTFAPSSTRDSATEITVSSGQESTIDIRYRAEPGHTVSGTVKNLGQNGASVTLVPVTGGWLPPSNIFQRPGDRGFAIRGVADGVYDLIAQQSAPVPGAPADLSFSDSRRITVKGNDVTGIELVTKPLGSISGTLALRASTAAECAGKRRPVIAEIMISAQQNNKGNESIPLVFQRTAANTAPEKDGTILWKNLVPGQYSFSPRFFARYWYVQSITHTTLGAASAKSALSNQKIDAAKNWTNLKSGERLAGLTITLAEGAGSVRGRLVVPEDRKVPSNLNVIFVPAEREKADDVLRYFAFEVAADQKFSADNLPPGRYWVIAQPRLDRDKPGSNLRLPDAATNRTKIRLAAELVKNEIELKPCQNVTDYQLTFK